MFRSCQQINCIAPALMTKKDELKMNFRISVRGAIRQAPSVLTWCHSLINMRAWGCSDPNVIIREWNEESSKGEQITGFKAHAVRMILGSMPKAVFDLLTTFVGDLGWANCPLNDDSLANKKTYPGHVFRHQRPGWKDLNRVTDASMELQFRMCFTENQNRPVMARKKADTVSSEYLTSSHHLE